MAKDRNEEQSKQCVLKVRERPSLFIGERTDGVTFTPDMFEAKIFTKLKDAQEHSSKINFEQLSRTLREQSLEVVEVEIGGPSFIVDLWVGIFAGLRKVLSAILYPVRILSDKIADFFFWLIQRTRKEQLRSDTKEIRIEGWVIFCNLLSLMIFYGLNKNRDWSFGLNFQTIGLCFGFLRVADIIVSQMNINLVSLDEYRNLKKRIEKKKADSVYAVRGYRRLLLLALHNYIEVIVWYAAFYTVFADQFNQGEVLLKDLLGALYFSLVTMATVGYGDITPQCTFGIILTMTQVLIGILLAIFVFARTLALMGRPLSQDRFEQ